MYHVIIVEDDPMVASINRQYVETDPMLTVEKIFKNGWEALQYLKVHEADLIILDYYTPLMTGREFIDQLHGAGKSPSVIMVTSANDIAIVESLISRGILDYLVKPFEYARFKAALDKFHQTRQLLKSSGLSLKQQDIDKILGSQNHQAASLRLAKGLNAATLSLIRDFLAKHRDTSYTSEQIAGQVSLSRITIRRYMNYLLETGEIISAIDYQTGGRPSMKYTYAGRPAE